MSALRTRLLDQRCEVARDHCVAATRKHFHGFLLPDRKADESEKFCLHGSAIKRHGRIAGEVTSKDEEITGRVYDELMPMFSDDGRFHADALAVLAKSYVELKTLPEEPDMKKLFTEAMLPK